MRTSLHSKHYTVTMAMWSAQLIFSKRFPNQRIPASSVTIWRRIRKAASASPILKTLSDPGDSNSADQPLCPNPGSKPRSEPDGLLTRLYGRFWERQRFYKKSNVDGKVKISEFQAHEFRGMQRNAEVGSVIKPSTLIRRYYERSEFETCDH